MKATTTSIKEMYNEFIEKNGFAPNRLYCVVEVENNDKYEYEHANIAIEPYRNKHDGPRYDYIWWFADDLDELVKLIDYTNGNSFRICDLIEMWSGK